ncbi:uncharacterized protein LOC126372133 isoform X1 [Pectinophora gossypiella]|uniref:uncharacterized protein LOC126372133 isoform X1 n=1 Tax=Pectinophora gossypiella TaxID=13191 RepID=UPI00214F275F|nr:uncharacterized protein LOC126372133 isoform X1 [Pectinophora gossypiella]
MRLTSNTGLLASVSQKNNAAKSRSESTITPELRCDVTPAPFMLRPYAGLYNPFPHACSVLCNHPADTEAKEFVKRAKDAWALEGKTHYFQEELATFHDGMDKEKIRTPHDIVTEDMFRRYTETDSRPLTPAPTLASGKSRGSRRCLTPDQPHTRTAIVLDLRRSHSQETLYYHGYTTSELTAGHTTSVTNDRSTLPSLNLSEGAHARLIKGQCEQLPPLASPLVLSKRAERILPPKEPISVRTAKKNQLKALNLNKPAKGKSKTNEPPSSQRSKGDKDTNDGSDTGLGNMDDGGSGERRRGKRRRKGRQGGSDRLTSAGLAAQTQQDPETQIAGIGTDSHNPSSRGSIAKAADEDDIILPVIRTATARKTDSFLDDEILKFLHREVDEDAIETEFDVKRRYVLQEALRTRPERPYGTEMQTLLKELKVPAVSLGDWLHIPRVFSRKNAQFTLPIDSNALQDLTPMQYAARFVTLKKSKQLLYLTVLRKFRPEGYRMPIKDIEEGLILMMGGILSTNQARHLKNIMNWENYVEEDNIPDEIKLTLLGTGHKRNLDIEGGDAGEAALNTVKYRTWCGICAICERMYGRFPPREKDPPDGMELSDFTMLETRLAVLKVHSGLVEILNTIRVR